MLWFGVKLVERNVTDPLTMIVSQTPKKMRKEKPPRGHPDRKPRHAGNPRRIPDMFRITSWQSLLKLADKHHDWINWRHLAAFYIRTVQIYKEMSPAQQSVMRQSGLLERSATQAWHLQKVTRPVVCAGGVANLHCVCTDDDANSFCSYPDLLKVHQPA